MNGPIEFSPEMDQDWLAQRINEIGTEETSRIGQARAQGAARGLEGQAQAGAMVSGANDWASNAKNKTISDFNMSLAGMNREERLTHEGRDYQSSEAEKDRAFREKLMERGFDQEANMMRAKNISEQQGAVVGGAFGLGEAGIGALGKYYA